QAEDGIRDFHVTGVQTCALPICALMPWVIAASMGTLVFFIALVTFWENPFPRYWQTPSGEVVAAMFGPSGVLNGLTGGIATLGRSEERRVGKECSGQRAARADDG